MSTNVLTARRSTIASLRGRLTVAVAAAWIAGLVCARPADAQVTYSYTGNPFNSFSCSPTPTPFTWVVCPTPGPFTTYTAAHSVSMTLTFDAALPANLEFQDIRGRAGYSLVMSDGQQTLTGDALTAGTSYVATDANGRIIRWSFVLTGDSVFAPNAIASHSRVGIPGDSEDFDLGCLTLGQLTVPDNCAEIFDAPGTWTSPILGPADAVRSLIDRLADPDLGLKLGQINSLTDKLNNVLASIEAGLYSQAIKQLTAFINEVQAALSGDRMNPETAATLIAAATAIIAML